MKNDPADAMKAVASAVTGAGTPETAAVVARPERSPVWALILSGPAISIMIVAGVAAAVLIFWPAAVQLVKDGRVEMVVVLDRIVQGLFAVVAGLTAILGVVVFRLASGGLKRVEAKAGPAELTVSTGDD